MAGIKLAGQPRKGDGMAICTPSEDKLFWYCYGTEEYLVKKNAREILMAYIESGIAQPDLETLPGPVPDMGALAYACGTISMYGGVRPVLLAGLEPGSFTDTQLADFLALTQELENAVLVAYTVVKEGKAPPGKRLKTVIDAAVKTGTAIESNKLTGSALAQFVARQAAAVGTNFATGAAALLLQTAGADLQTLENEVAKLAAAANYTEITQAQVRALATPTVETNVFDMADAIFAKDGRRVFTLLQKLLEEGQDEIAISGALAGSYVDMYRVKLAAAERIAHATVHKDFGYKGSDWRLKKSAERAARYTLTQLKTALVILFELDTALKSAPTSNRILLEGALTRLLGI